MLKKNVSISMYIIIVTCIHYKIRLGLTNYEVKTSFSAKY